MKYQSALCKLFGKDKINNYNILFEFLNKNKLINFFEKTKSICLLNDIINLKITNDFAVSKILNFINPQSQIPIYQCCFFNKIKIK